MSYISICQPQMKLFKWNFLKRCNLKWPLKINHAKDVQDVYVEMHKIKGDLINVLIPHVHGPEN